jgi:hypothetical protein
MTDCKMDWRVMNWEQIRKDVVVAQFEAIWGHFSGLAKEIYKKVRK